ncbi:MAG: hybrid sensor histidine kinase/response regulator, partial [Myxococcales bacterium]|nr:hybrid sensor histidine kinase/response regulator [Myxococcales bacterium]
MPCPTERRILIVDDNASIHEDFRKIFAPPDATGSTLDELEALLLDRPVAAASPHVAFELISAFQGREALEHVTAAVAAGRPFPLAFVDMRMPPGWDGVETIERIWRVDPDVQIVICSAYSDYSWSELHARLGTRESLLILKKPFDTAEVVQCAHALTTKWQLARQIRAHVDQLEATVASRTRELQTANEALAEHIRVRERMEVELRLSQKLEAVGQLAAGVAHEINTPIQYVADNLQFLREGMLALSTMGRAVLDAASAARTAETVPLLAQLDQLAEDADLDYLTREIPRALDSVNDGVARIARIVQAMKELAHPGPREATAVDLPRALQNALDVTAAAYRYVADVETEFAAMPTVVCFGSDLNQVFLNLIVNAAQAMEDKRTGRGVLGVRARIEGDDAVIAISDTGDGIPEADRDRVFDAFFTTKEVGRGTGQGLAISRSIVVDRHGGTLTFDSQLGVGTTFFVRIP